MLTDSDFGRAYLTEGWAPIFLHKLFERYAALFIGYSHKDPIKNYLGRGLPPRYESDLHSALLDRKKAGSIEESFP